MFWCVVHCRLMVRHCNHCVIGFYLDVFVFPFSCHLVSKRTEPIKEFTILTMQSSIFQTDCESLIRKMLVLDPHRRYTIEQIKHHRWMMIEVMDPISLACDNQNVSARCGTTTTEPNEQILRLMAGLGIDTQKTCDSLKVGVFQLR